MRAAVKLPRHKSERGCYLAATVSVYRKRSHERAVVAHRTSIQTWRRMCCACSVRNGGQLHFKPARTLIGVGPTACRTAIVRPLASTITPGPSPLGLLGRSFLLLLFSGATPQQAVPQHRPSTVPQQHSPSMVADFDFAWLTAAAMHWERSPSRLSPTARARIRGTRK